MFDYATFAYLALLSFPAAMTFAGFNDMVSLTIPNKLSLFLIAAFLVAAAAVQMPLDRFGLHLAVGFTMLVIMMTLWAFGFLGGGDAKLIAVASLWIGFDDLPLFVAYVAIFGGLLCLVVLSYRQMMPPRWAFQHEWALRLHEKTGGVPYGLAIGSAGLVLFPETR
ncbi:MAG: prepilin peptidase, partial [Pseudomonadota bacterium]